MRSRPRRASASTATRSRRTSRRSRAAGPTSRSSSTRSSRPGSPQEPLHGLGLHGREHREPHRADAVDSRSTPTPSSATPLPTTGLQGNAPDFTITDVLTKDDPTNPPHDHGVENIREVTGTYKVPCYLSTGCSNGSGVYPPGAKYDLDSNGLPQQTGDDARRASPATSRGRPSPRPARDRRLRRRPHGPPVDVRPRPLRRLHRGPHGQRRASSAPTTECSPAPPTSSA